MASLSEGSDLIVAGQITAVHEETAGTVQVHGKQFPSIHMTAIIQVEQVLKGSFDSPLLEVGFDLPDTPAGSIGYRGVSAGAYRLVFLKGSKNGYDFVNPFYPSLVAARGTRAINAALLYLGLGQ